MSFTATISLVGLEPDNRVELVSVDDYEDFMLWHRAHKTNEFSAQEFESVHLELQDEYGEWVEDMAVDFWNARMARWPGLYLRMWLINGYRGL